MLSFKRVSALAVIGLALSLSLSAATVDVNSVAAVWTSATAPAGDFPCIAGVGTANLSWGHNAAPCDLTPAQQSGFDVNPTIPPPQSFVVPPDTGWFKLADFVHRNNPVNDPITSAVLQLSVAMDIDGTPQTPVFSYTFNLNETPNNPPGGCGPAGGTPTGSGGQGCNDVVSIVPPASPATFIVGGTTVTLQLRFSQDGGATTTNDFITLENQNNPAALFGRITADVGDVPEPATLFLAGGALLAAGMGRRFRKARS